MQIDVWVSRDMGSNLIDIWNEDPGDVYDGGWFVNRQPDLEMNLRIAERLGYGVLGGQKRHVRSEVRDVE